MDLSDLDDLKENEKLENLRIDNIGQLALLEKFPGLKKVRNHSRSVR